MVERKSKSKTGGQQGEKEKEFSKDQLLASERFRDRRDLVNALLSPDKTYTAGVVEQMILDYMKGMVN